MWGLYIEDSLHRSFETALINIARWEMRVLIWGEGNTWKYLFLGQCIIESGNKYNYWAVLRNKKNWDVGICSEISTIYLLSPAMLNCLKLVERGLEELIRLEFSGVQIAKVKQVRHFSVLMRRPLRRLYMVLQSKLRKKLKSDRGEWTRNIRTAQGIRPHNETKLQGGC